MGRKRTGETPVYSYRMRPDTAQKLNKIQRELKEEWADVFEKLVEHWGKNNCTTEIISVIQKKEVGDENKMMDIFYKINPTIKYANKTQRGAVSRLYKRLGQDKALRSAEAAVAIHGKPYAPTITNPLQLENRLSELVAFYKKNQSNQILSI